MMMTLRKPCAKLRRPLISGTQSCLSFSTKDSYMANLLSSRLKLNDLRDNKGARKAKRKKGRGHNSGRGRKSGRGMKGQKAHSNNFPIAYIGGSRPLHLKIPKKGDGKKGPELTVVSLDRIGRYVDEERLCAAKPITMKAMFDAGLFKRAPHGVKILRGKKIEGVPPDLFFHHKVLIEATAASKGAKTAVEKYGGRLKTVYFAKMALRAHMAPWAFEFLPRSNGVPPPRLRARYGFGAGGVFGGDGSEPSFDFDLFLQRAKACEESGATAEILKKLSAPLPKETQIGRNYRLKKKRYYEPKKRKALAAIPPEIKNDKEKLELLKMKCRLKITS